MKKVFLVFVHLYYIDGSDFKLLLNTFACKRKAHVYVNYKLLSFKRDGGSAFGDVDICRADFNIKVEYICTLDYSSELKKLEDETLNDVIAPKDRARLERSIASLDKRLAVLWQKQCERFEANRLAEEQRNFELTKQFNLLEFV